MAKGKSKAGGSAGTGAGGATGAIVMNQVADIDGSMIDLSNSPLTYGDDDSALTGNARKNIKAFEDKRYKNKVEYAYFVMADGTQVGVEYRGGSGSVRTPVWVNKKADGAMSHNHPREKGIIGGTFSYADLKNFCAYNRTTTRATAKEGTYSISKGNNFNGDGLKKAFKAFDKQNSINCQRAMGRIRRDLQSGKIGYNTYKRLQAQNANKMLVKLHDFLLANQSQYGYTYTLERR